jgi:hypothetical protein
MSKKSRRARTKYKATNKSPKTTANTVAGQTNQSVESTRAVPSTQQSGAIKSPGYGYVLTELRQIGIIAGVLILVIIVLTFVLN